MDTPKDYQEDDETQKLLKEVQEQREQQERDIAGDAHALDVRRVKEMMSKSPGAMQHEVQAKMEDESEKKS